MRRYETMSGAFGRLGGTLLMLLLTVAVGCGTQVEADSPTPTVEPTVSTQESSATHGAELLFTVHGDFQPVFLANAEPLEKLSPIIVVTPERIFVDGSEVIRSTSGFVNEGQGWQRLRHSMTKRHDEAVTLAVDRRVPMIAVRRVASILREIHVHEVTLLVSVGAKNQPHGSSPPDVGGIDIAIGPHTCSHRDPDDAGLDLVLAIDRRGGLIVSSGGILAGGCEPSTEYERPTRPFAPTVPSRADVGFDYQYLQLCLARIASEYPDEQYISIGTTATTTFDTFLRVVAVSVGTKTDPLLPEVFFYTGEDAIDSCGPPDARSNWMAD